MKNDLNQTELLNTIQSNKRLIVFGYAPICATCAISYRMLKIVQDTLKFNFYSIDLNYHQEWVQEEQIMSAPALLLIENGEIVERIYAFRDVSNLFEKLENFTVDERI